MARERSPARDKAFEIYKEHKGDITNREIASILETSEKTISGWKAKDKWNENFNGVLQKKIRSTPKENSNKKVAKEAIAKEVKEVLANTELTDKQRLFCVIYSRCLNATKAYQKAYKCTYETAMVEGCKSLRNPKISEQIESLNSVQFNAEFIKKSLIQKYIDIAFSDITEYVKFGEEEIIVYDKDGQPRITPEGEIMTSKFNYVTLGDSQQVDGTLITEISEGKAGIKIKLADKMKAMDFLTKHYNLLSDEEKTKLDIEYKKLQNRKIGAEIAKINGESDDDEKEDDGFVEALGGTAKEDWADEEI